MKDYQVRHGQPLHPHMAMVMLVGLFMMIVRLEHLAPIPLLTANDIEPDYAIFYPGPWILKPCALKRLLPEYPRGMDEQRPYSQGIGRALTRNIRKLMAA